MVRWHQGGGQKTVPLRKLVTEPLRNLKDLLGNDKNSDLKKHEQHLYRRSAVEMGKDFLQTYHNPNTDVRNRLSQHRLDQINENKERLVPIVRATIFLGRQGLAFRGHRDDGPLLDVAGALDDSVTKNEGNFRETLRLMVASGDTKLEKHLQDQRSRATYISKTSQNELINCIGDEILERVLRGVEKCKFYSVLFDETTDMSHTSQLSLNMIHMKHTRIF
ncbi:hypothetical protein FOCC_FOCC003565 [Frankliniella occidentalis]|nr:hypothetical protein FOCC_FOCC003565 [Frankliniella occidentalis]